MCFYFIVLVFKSMCFSIFYFVSFGYSTPLTPSVMEPYGRKSLPSMTSLTCVANDAMESTNFYNIKVSNDDQVATDVVEGGVNLIRAYQEDGEVEIKLEGIILDLGCTSTVKY